MADDAGASAPELVTLSDSGSKPFYKIKLSGYGGDVERVAQAMLWSFLCGLLVAGFGAWSRWLFALLWAGACSSVGWVLGFLFGIPRTLSGQSAPTTGQAVVGVQEDDASGSPAKATARIGSGPSSVNTNLEQVSDWLTKIIVGVGLVEFTKVRDAMISSASIIAASLGGPYWNSFALALMVYFTVTGFLGSYLLTRLFLQKLLTNSE